MVLLHGLCLDQSSWDIQIGQLIRKWGNDIRIISYDHRGHGDSADAPMHTYRIEQLADDLATLLIALRVKGPLTLAGHSMGGMTALAYLARSASHRPVEPKSLVLVATAAGKLAQPGPRSAFGHPRGNVTVSATALRPGDVIDLAAPDVVPADARLLVAEDLEVDESLLTGESLPVDKQVDPVAAADTERASMLFEGSTIVAGHARAIVVATGVGTAAHRAISAVVDVESSAGVQARLRELTGKVLPLTLAGGAAVTGLALLRRATLRQAVADGVAIAVAAVPEGLPLVATLSQLAAAQRLSTRGVLVRAPRTIEALGRVDTICFDKTGTLTENRLRLVRAVPAASDPHGPFPGVADPEAARVLQAAARATTQPHEAQGHAHATDEAIVKAAASLKDDVEWNLLAEVPFESSRGFAASIGTLSADATKPLLMLKGAPEVILPRCRFDDPQADQDRAELMVHNLAEQGLRVLAVAQRSWIHETEDDDDTDADAVDAAAHDLELIGYVGLADTARPSARPLIEALSEAGRDVVLITGDHPVTARAIARQLGLPADARVVTGADLNGLDEDASAKLAADVQVFARVSPEQKVQIVGALQRCGRVTAMVGDGANDAAAIRMADVGIGVSGRGSSAARGAADIVLTDEDLTVLLDTLVEGRGMWAGVRDAVTILVGGNVGEVLFTIIGTALGTGRAPVGTRQLLLVNLLTDMFPALAVAVTPQFEEPDADEYDTEEEAFEARRAYQRSVLTGPTPSLDVELMRQIVTRGAVTAAGATAAWAIGRWTPGTERRTSTMGLTALVTTQLAQTLLTRRHSPLVVATALGSSAVLVAIVQTPGVSHFFGAIMGSNVDALLVGGVMAVNALTGGTQRLRADAAAAELFAEQDQLARRVVVPTVATARRRLEAARNAERTVTVSATALRPGDVIDLAAPDVVPADARLLVAEDLEVDESLLTGESLPVDKQVDPVAAADTERASMLFEGSTIVAGHARAIVVATGVGTAAHRAISAVVDVESSAGVQARLRELTGKVLPLTLAGGAAVTGLALLRRATLRQAVADGVAIAVAAVPEGLPLVATLSQLAAAQRLSTRGVLVRAPRTIEALGRVDTICFDKTGTLTENRLRLVQSVPAATNPHGPFPGVAEPAAARVLQAAARATTQPHEAQGHAHATDEAIVKAAAALKDDVEWNLLAEVPFESSRGFAASIGTLSADPAKPLLMLKGAPEVILPRCRFDDPQTDLDHAESLVHALAEQGLRVLAVARRSWVHETEDDDDTDADAVDAAAHDLELIGYVGLADTARPSARPLIEALSEANRDVVLITGDHPVTARAIARQLGLSADVRVVTGADLNGLDEDASAKLAADVQVFARVSPEQKVQIVGALQRCGRVTAMVGDGANDAAAIRMADVGIGVSGRGSSAARGAADIVLTDDDLTVLLDTLVEGRGMWAGVRDAVTILVGGNVGEVLFTIIGTALGSGRAPVGTRQLLLVNLLTDMFPALAVAVTPQFEEPDADEYETEEEAVEARRAYQQSVLTGPTPSLDVELMRQIVTRGAVTAAGATAAWAIGRWTPGTERRTSTMGLTALVTTQLAQTLLTRRHSPLVVATALGSSAVLVAIVQTPGVSHFFGCTPLGPVAWTGSSEQPRRPPGCRCSHPTGWPKPREWCSPNWREISA